MNDALVSHKVSLLKMTAETSSVLGENDEKKQSPPNEPLQKMTGEMKMTSEMMDRGGAARSEVEGTEEEERDDA